MVCLWNVLHQLMCLNAGLSLYSPAVLGGCKAFGTWSLEARLEGLGQFPVWALCLLITEGCKPCHVLLLPQLELLIPGLLLCSRAAEENKLLFPFLSGIWLQLWGKQRQHKVVTEMRCCVGLWNWFVRGMWKTPGCGLENPRSAVSRVCCWTMPVGVRQCRWN